MTWMRKIVFFIGLLFVFLFAFNAEQKTVVTMQPQKSNPCFRIDHDSIAAFIQTPSFNLVVLNCKTNVPLIANWFESFLILIPDFKATKTVTPFENQDINRCKKVSILLFPYHIFW